MGIKYRDNSIVGAFVGPTPIRDVYAGDSLMWHNYLYDWQYSTNNGNVTLKRYNGSYDGAVTVPTAEQVGSNVQIDTAAFRGDLKLNRIDLQNVPFENSSMNGAFRSCHNLTFVNNIPLVTDVSFAFDRCTNLWWNVTLPSSVQFMNRTFWFCTNLMGNVTIQSSSVQAAFNCFDNSSIHFKNVYFPFNYTGSRVRTNTFNAFKNAGYITASGRSTEKDYVRVYDLPLTRGMRFDPPDDER